MSLFGLKTQRNIQMVEHTAKRLQRPSISDIISTLKQFSGDYSSSHLSKSAEKYSLLSVLLRSRLPLSSADGSTFRRFAARSGKREEEIRAAPAAVVSAVSPDFDKIVAQTRDALPSASNTNDDCAASPYRMCYPIYLFAREEEEQPRKKCFLRSTFQRIINTRIRALKCSAICVCINSR